MFRLILFTLFVVGSVSYSYEYSKQTITVMLSQSRHFDHHQIPKLSPLHTLDLKLIENFSKQFKLNTKFVFVNESLNEVFAAENLFQSFSKSAEYS